MKVKDYDSQPTKLKSRAMSFKNMVEFYENDTKQLIVLSVYKITNPSFRATSLSGKIL